VQVSLDKKLKYQDAIRVLYIHMYMEIMRHIYKHKLLVLFFKIWGHDLYKIQLKSFEPLAVELLKSLSIYQLELSKVQLIKVINYRLFKTPLAIRIYSIPLYPSPPPFVEC